jgi:SAM-dependent methyltransferase
VADHWFESVAEVLGSAYLRYSFTKGTDQEVDFLVDELGLQAGDRVLDVGCGPGRHAHELARRGIRVHGIDISHRFIELARLSAPEGATFERLDARSLSFDGEFDAVVSLCQGAFGLGNGPLAADSDDSDLAVLEGMRRALVPGASLALTAFSAYFQLRHLGDADDFDAARGVNHEHTVVRDELGTEHPAELWTTVYTPRELRFLAARVGLEVDGLWSVEPGRYQRQAPVIDEPELLLVATRPRGAPVRPTA